MTREKVITLVVVPVVLVVLSGIVFPSILGHKGHSGPKLELGDVVVDDSTNPHLIKQPVVELAVHNIGDRTAVLDRLRFTVLGSVRVASCASQGDLVVVQSYGLRLPADARIGYVAETRPLRRELKPDEAERLAVSIGSSRARPNEAVAYQLAVSLSHDQQPHAVALGRIVVLTPAGDPAANGATFEQSPGPSVPPPQQLVNQFRFSADTVRCFRDNTIALDRLLAAPGTRSDSLSAIGRRLYSPRAARAIHLGS